MPAVEMRRSTRVFVPKAKDGGLVKVLRSGRRLWGDPSVKTALKNDVVLFPLMDDSSDFKSPPPPTQSGPLRQEEDVPKPVPKPVQEPEPMDVEEEKNGMESEARVKESEQVCRNESRVIRNVYSRKRKRNSGVLDSGSARERRQFGLHFVRRKRRKGVESGKVVERKVLGDVSDGDTGVFEIVVEGLCGGCSLVSRLLGSMLRNLGDETVELSRFSGFLASSPIGDVFASFGVRFLLNHRSSISRGVCRISGVRQRIPLLSVDFCAIPSCFTGLYLTILLKSLRLSCSYGLVFNIVKERTCEGERDDARCDPMVNVLVAPDRVDKGNKKILVAGLEASKVGGRTLQIRNGVLSRSPLKRRRRSLRNRRARNPSHFVMQKGNGLSVSNSVVFKKNGLQLPPIFRDPELRRSVHKNPACELKVPKSTGSDSSDLNVDVVDSHQLCSANVMVVETDKCYRIVGAEVALDLSSGNEWVLAVRKDGMTRYSLKVHREMRPHSVNRFTHAAIWTAENGWKLEFPDKKDWIVFKELYKLCGERNIGPDSPAVKNIPVPGVSEVADFWGPTIAFERPESYIRVASDELSRILLRRTANYDMDSDDEGWLREFNSGLDEATCLSDETFELMIDAFEKGSYCSVEDGNEEKAAVTRCVGLASEEVILSVHGYWTKKRKEKGASLLRVFELNEPRRAQLITKPVLRKKRSLKRTSGAQPSPRGRGKDSTILQAMAVENTILEEQHAVLRAQEARATADKLIEVAIQKRQRAQLLMESADLATYRATMALRIADAAATGAVDPQQAASHFLDDEDNNKGS